MNSLADIPYMLSAAGLEPTALSFGKQQSLFLAGDPVKRMHFVLEGNVVMTRTLENGNELVVQRAGPGDLFAEASMFSAVYCCNATAETPLRCIAYDRSEVLNALSNPELSFSVLSAYAREIRKLRTQIELRNIKRADDRILSYLITLPKESDGWCSPGLPWKDISRTLGLSHEACYRTLAQLARERRLEKDGQRIRLLET